MEDERKRKNRKKILLVAILIAAAAVYGVISGAAEQDAEVSRNDSSTIPELSADSDGDGKTDEEENDKASDPGEQEDGEMKGEAVIYVDVGGAVIHPGVVSVAEGARVFEAIEAAGGTTSEAETKYINMASLCADGQKLYVPTVSEAEKAVNGGSGTENLFSADPSALFSENTGGEGGKININTATSQQLQTLTGIGPSMAQRIIEYRQSNGDFRSVEDLKNVSGIGDKTLEKFISQICV